MKNLLISIILCNITKLSIAQFALTKITNPDTVFSSTWKTDLINTRDWKLANEFTEISGRLYSTPNENLRGYLFKFFDSNVTIKPNPIDTIKNYSIKYITERNSFQLKLPLYVSEDKITYLIFSYKLCFLDSSYLLVERELQPIYLDLTVKNALSSKKVVELNRRAFPSWELYQKKDPKVYRKFTLFRRVDPK